MYKTDADYIHGIQVTTITEYNLWKYGYSLLPKLKLMFTLMPYTLYIEIPSTHQILPKHKK